MLMANPELFDGERPDDGGRRVPVDPRPVPSDATRSRRSPAVARTCDGATYEMTGEGLLARIFQHETDHLDGALYIDHLDEQGRRAVMAELRRLELEIAEPRKRRLLRRGEA